MVNLKKILKIVQIVKKIKIENRKIFNKEGVVLIIKKIPTNDPNKITNILIGKKNLCVRRRIMLNIDCSRKVIINNS